MAFKQYIAQKKRLYISFTTYLESPINDDANEFENFTQVIQNQKIFQDKEEASHFLNLISSFIQNHHRDADFISKIQKILDFYAEEIKQALSNNEIYEIVKTNKLILLYLINKKILTINGEIFDQLSNYNYNYINLDGTSYSHFFLPEIKTIISKEKFDSIENKILFKKPDFYNNYETKRLIGENDSYLCNLIRNDSIEEFISIFGRIAF